jgi:hypothetical protein
MQAYQKENSSLNFPYPLLFIVLPILLHQESRKSLPKRTDKSFFDWIAENQHLKIHFAQRAKGLVPFIREAIIFLLQHNAIEFQQNGKLLVKEYRKKKITDENKEEIEEIFDKASFLGRWLSKAGDTKTIFAVLGVKP